MGRKNAESVGEEDVHEDIRTQDAATNKKMARHARGASLFAFFTNIFQVVRQMI
jgi:hypothetical protein